jgi:hypothetical protein
MPDRKRVAFTLGLTSSLAMLALVLVAPIRLPGTANVSSNPDCLRGVFTATPGQPTTSLSPVTAIDAVRKMKAHPSENDEEEGADALAEPQVSFLSLCSSCKFPDRRLIAPSSILSLYPLRC